jgi:hypothetical protein
MRGVAGGLARRGDARRGGFARQRPQDLQIDGPGAEPIPGHGRHQPNAASARDRRHRRARRLGHAVAAVENQADRQRAQDRRRAARVVGLRVRHHQRVEPAHARGAQLADHRCFTRPGVHEDGVQSVLDERRVALADVEHADPHARGRGRQPVGPARGDDTRGNQCRRSHGETGGKPARARRRAQQRTAPALGAQCEDCGGARRAYHRDGARREPNLRVRRGGRDVGQPREVGGRVGRQLRGHGRGRRGDLPRRGREEPEPHGGRHSGHGQHVGGQCDERRALEVDRYERRRPDRRRGGQRGRFGEARGHPAGPEPLAQRPRQQEDGHDRREAQLPARLLGGPRVERERHGRGQQHRLTARRRPAGQHCHHAGGPHDARALNRRAGARQRDVQRDQDEDAQ